MSHTHTHTHTHPNPYQMPHTIIVLSRREGAEAGPKKVLNLQSERVKAQIVDAGKELVVEAGYILPSFDVYVLNENMQPITRCRIVKSGKLTSMNFSTRIKIEKTHDGSSGQPLVPVVKIPVRQVSALWCFFLSALIASMHTDG